jgi:hypothetical protein
MWEKKMLAQQDASGIPVVTWGKGGPYSIAALDGNTGEVHLFVKGEFVCTCPIAGEMCDICRDAEGA